MTDTHRALLNDKKQSRFAPHVLLSLLIITSPTLDVLPIVWTDYTYDSEHCIAEGVPLAFSTQLKFLEGKSRFSCHPRCLWLSFFRWTQEHIFCLYIERGQDHFRNHTKWTWRSSKIKYTLFISFHLRRHWFINRGCMSYCHIYFVSFWSVILDVPCYTKKYDLV